MRRRAPRGPVRVHPGNGLHAVWWHYGPTRTGYGAEWDVPAFVLGELEYPARVAIAAKMRDGSWVPRRVRPTRLRPREQTNG